MGRVRKSWIVGVLVVALAGVGFGLYWFQPWKLWQDETVDEALPVAVGSAAPPTGTSETGTSETGTSETGTSETGAPATGTPDAGPLTLAQGDLISHEHDTSGSVKLVRLADGSHVVRLEDLDTSNGPDLRVLLTDAPVKEGTAGWRVFDDGRHISLGKLKGNKGSQNYTVPADLDLTRYSSVSIWCDRFDVSFGAAELARA
ncbi:DM13 domain-containing protein [Streptomyces sp. NPDC048002]|uniref:DM13 domain-containing protein n=1 Tax=Streptomyces sp. NPDC048002 TaxID=3154344 RepID=UPI0034027FD6